MLPTTGDVTAPDGSQVRILLGRPGGSVAHFSLAAGAVSIPVAHRTVDEIWYVLDGHGAMWRSLGDQVEEVELGAGVCLTIPVGAMFQFRSVGPGPLTAIGVAMPPWPGDGEAILGDGPWEPTVEAGPGLAERP